MAGTNNTIIHNSLDIRGSVTSSAAITASFIGTLTGTASFATTANTALSLASGVTYTGRFYKELGTLITGSVTAGTDLTPGVFYTTSGSQALYPTITFTTGSYTGYEYEFFVVGQDKPTLFNSGSGLTMIVNPAAIPSANTLKGYQSNILGTHITARYLSNTTLALYGGLDGNNFV